MKRNGGSDRGTNAGKGLYSLRQVRTRVRGAIANDGELIGVAVCVTVDRKAALQFAMNRERQSGT